MREDHDTKRKKRDDERIWGSRAIKGGIVIAINLNQAAASTSCTRSEGGQQNGCHLDGNVPGTWGKIGVSLQAVSLDTIVERRTRDKIAACHCKLAARGWRQVVGASSTLFRRVSGPQLRQELKQPRWGWVQIDSMALQNGYHGPPGVR